MRTFASTKKLDCLLVFGYSVHGRSLRFRFETLNRGKMLLELQQFLEKIHAAGEPAVIRGNIIKRSF